MITVYPFGPEREQDLRVLFAACMDFYELPAIEEATASEMMAELDASAGMSAALAYRDMSPVGFATWVRMFPAGQGFAFYLKELFVVPAAQGQGAGRKLLRYVTDVAAANGVRRVEWSSGMAQAIGFYDSLGAPKAEKAFYRLPASAFESFAAEDT